MNKDNDNNNNDNAKYGFWEFVNDNSGFIFLAVVLIVYSIPDIIKAIKN